MKKSSNRKIHGKAFPPALRKIFAVALCAALPLAGLAAALLMLRPTLAANPGTQAYYDQNWAASKVKAGNLPVGAPYTNAAGNAATTTTEGPWKLNLNWGGTCSQPWDGSTTMIAAAAWNALPNVNVTDFAGGTVTAKAITTAEQLLYAVNNRVSFQLQNDIDLAGYMGRSWNCTASSTLPTTVWVADGKGHTIYNYYHSGTTPGLFRFVNNHANAVIKNLRVSNSRINITGTVSGQTAFLCSGGGANAVNCAVENAYASTGRNLDNQYICSLLVMSAGTHTVDNCYANNVHLYNQGLDNGSGSAHISGFIIPNGLTTIKNCFIINSTAISNGGHSGGFISCYNPPAGAALSVLNCFADVEIYGNKNTAVFVGVMGTGRTNFTDCYASGKVEGVDQLGGFGVDMTGASDAASDHGMFYQRCYSTAAVGLLSNATTVGGFIAAPTADHSSDRRTINNCYAAGETGSLSTDVSLNRTLSKTAGGFMGLYASAQTTAIANCWYDKQTTAMREWAAGNHLHGGYTSTAGTSAGGYIAGVKGVLTTDTAKSGRGLASAPAPAGSAGFTGFSDNSQWVFEQECYPQLKVFANPTTFTNTNWMTQQELNNLVKAFSRASTSTVKLDTWENDFNGGALPATTYDTVRDIMASFDMTKGDENAWKRVGDGANSAGGTGNTTTINGQLVPVVKLTPETGVSGARYRVSNLQPGIEWLRVNVTIDGQVGTRALRVVPTSGLTAGPNVTVNRDVDTYDHRNGVFFAYSSASRFNSDPTDVTQANWAAAVAPPNAATDFNDVNTTPITSDTGGTPITRSSKVQVRISPITGYDGNAEPVLGAPVALVNSPTDPNTLIFTNTTPMPLRGKYMVQYFWIMGDGRYMSESKTLNIMFDPELMKNAYRWDNSAGAYETTPQNGDEALGQTPVAVRLGDKISYELTLQAPDEALLPQYDIVFVLDWSASMAGGYMTSGSSGGTQSAILYTRDLLMDLCQNIFGRYPGSRIAVMGLNSTVDVTKVPGGASTDTPSMTYLQYDTDFVGPGDYASVIATAFQDPPRFTEDDNASFLRAAIEKLDGDTGTLYGNGIAATPAIPIENQMVKARTDKGRAPVIVMFSDFQTDETDAPPSNPFDPVENFWTVHMKQHAQEFRAKLGDEAVLLTVRMDHGNNPAIGPPTDEKTRLMEENVMLYENWENIVIPNWEDYLDAFNAIVSKIDGKIATPATMTDYLPAGLTFLGETHTGTATFTQTGQKLAWHWSNLQTGLKQVTVEARVTEPYSLYANRGRINIQTLDPIYSNVTRHQYVPDDPEKNAYVSSDNGVSWQPKKNGTAEAPVLVKPNDWIKYEFAIDSAKLPLPLRVQDAREFKPPSLAADAPTPIQFINGSFEEPDLLAETIDYFPMEDVPGWSTRPTNPADNSNPNAQVIEIQRVNGQSGFAAVQAAGPQYAELNAYVRGVLYQVCNTTPGMRVYWEFYHSARAAGSTDVMEFFLAPATSPSSVNPLASEPKPYKIQSCSDGYANASRPWGHYTGTYDIPAGQTKTEFAFASISASFGVGGGNYLDGIRLYTPSYLVLTKSVDKAKVDVGGRLSYSVKVENIGECDASGTVTGGVVNAEGVVFTDILAPGLDFVTGSLQVLKPDNSPYAGATATYLPDTKTIRVSLGKIKGTNATSSDCEPYYTIRFQADVNGSEIAEDLKYANQAKAVYRDRDHETEALRDYVGYSNVVETELERRQNGTLTDILPDGLLYQSHTTGGAAFSRTGQTGKWTWSGMPSTVWNGGAASKVTVEVIVKVDEAKILYDNKGTLQVDGLTWLDDGGNPTDEADTNHTYHRAQYILHVRQVVLTPSIAGLSPPEKGYFKLKNRTPAVYLPATCPSGPDGTAYETYLLLANSDPLYLAQLLVPQFYQYVGYKVSDANGSYTYAGGTPPLNTANPNRSIRADFSGAGELWLTMYLRPFSNTPDKSDSAGLNWFGPIKTLP
ncbi:MAG: DUF11 domain-containing protein [Oscillospiraceae bacterium]|jgi:uncharacterized repeat protein (TIGR01451 family)|nr:DUF11 domain-containing protein [Oscillospiraceae bacterium]